MKEIERERERREEKTCPIKSEERKLKMKNPIYPQSYILNNSKTFNYFD